MDPDMQKFIDDTRGEVDTAIRGMVDNPNYNIGDDEEREEFIINDEGWYLRAQAAGVDV